MEDKQRIQEMKKELRYLCHYTTQLRLQSILYQNQSQPLHVEDGLVDYLHYTASIVHCKSNKTNHQQNVYLDAMEKQEAYRNRKMKQDLRAYMLLQAINELKPLEKDLLFDIYVRRLDKKTVMHRQGDIVESTLHRRINRAALHLWHLLHFHEKCTD